MLLTSFTLQLLAQAQLREAPVTLGQSYVVLNGPWRLDTGDDLGWADPNFDDSAWETADLTTPPRGHVPRWVARRRGSPGTLCSNDCERSFQSYYAAHSRFPVRPC